VLGDSEEIPCVVTFLLKLLQGVFSGLFEYFLDVGHAFLLQVSSQGRVIGFFGL
jgi:hypothetical protein